ncbi:MAG: alpha/beta fold hydrolase [Chloroflexi bacterium]|nr:alpha/beta fold hydrolase [Chloroflexota bacterium]
MLEGVTIVGVNFPSQGEKLRGELILPKADKAVPGVLLCHGMASDRRAMKPSALSLARRGIASLTFDFRGHGESSGLCDGDTVADVIAAWDYFRQWPPIDPQRVALVGHSMGAMSALIAAPKLEGMAALVSLAAPPDLDEVEMEDFLSFSQRVMQRETPVVEYPRVGRLPYLGKIHGTMSWLWMWMRGYSLRINWLKCWELWRALKISAALPRLKPCPLLFVHCRGDKATPYQASINLYEKAKPPKELLIAEGGFHAAPLFPGRVRRKWLNWLASNLVAGASNHRKVPGVPQP